MKRKADHHREQPSRSPPLRTYDSRPQYGARADPPQGGGHFRVESRGHSLKALPPPRGTFQHG
eukprot:CAMPEP_0197558406 /NCGR_PEP_ID=MMETSP1320-20131121/19169_1 /TAXON_ID=91990 /ORGANISM="Bolidomonas sp., Strain RCC2347" /LENGTH=62 /DNA_ID=CAMNT_0043119715 /DNA_START=186 /DNA_END=371 /DNA_ORIENTATION=+